MCFIVHHATTGFPLFYKQLHLRDSWSQGDNIYIAYGKTTRRENGEACKYDASKHDICNNEIRDASGRDCWGLKKFKVEI